MSDSCGATKYESVDYADSNNVEERYRIYLEKFCFCRGVTKEQAEQLLIVKYAKEEIFNGNK